MSQSGVYVSTVPIIGNVLTLTGDTGGAVPPTGGNIDILGSANINTVGTPFASTITVNLDDDVTIAGHFTAGATLGSITAQTGDISVIAGNINLPNTLSTGTEGIITFGGNNYIQNFGGNFFLGKGAGNLTLNPVSATGNVALGEASLSALTTGNDNTAVGFEAMLSATTAHFNCAYGGVSLQGLTTGIANQCFGYGAGGNYLSSESSNVLFAHSGVVGESNVVRIGSQGSAIAEQNTCYIAGIINNTVANAELVTINSATSQLGVTSAVALTWQTLTSNANLAVGNGYFVNGSSQLTLTLPTTANVGDVIQICVIGPTGASAVKGWKIAQNAGQNIILNLAAANNTISQSTVGTGGNIKTIEAAYCILICNVANTQFIAITGSNVNPT